MADLNYISDKTEAIVLCTIPINDHTQFVHLYTRQRGRITCRVPLTQRGRRGQQLRLLMTPMTLLRLDLKPDRGDVLQILEAEIIRSPYQFTMANPLKGTQCQYVAELTQQVVRPLEQDPDPALWQFLLHSLDALESADEGWANFHLVFTCQLIGHLGFSIDPSGYTDGDLFDMNEGVFTAGPIYHPYYLNATSAQWLHRMLLVSYDDMATLSLNREQRRAMLDILLTFLQLQLPEMGKLKCLEFISE